MLFLVIATSAIAVDAIQEERSLLIDQLKAYNTEHDQLTAKRAEYSKRLVDLQWAFDQIEKQFRTFKVDRADLDKRMAMQAEKVRIHDARCHGTFASQEYVDTCNFELRQINAVVVAQNVENQSLNKTLSLIKAADETHTEESNKVAAADKTAFDRLNVIVTLARPIVERLKAVKRKNDDCKAAIAAVDADPTNMLKKERMHDVCGEMFDGNR